MASSSGAITPIPSKIIDVIDINDGGYKYLFYIFDYSGNRIVVNDLDYKGAAHKIGDTVKIQALKILSVE